MDPFLRLSTITALWVAWCAIHSILSRDGPLGSTELLKGPVGRFHRLFYNLFAVASLAVVCALIPHKNEVEIVKWSGPLVAIQALVWAAAFFILYLSSRLLDGWGFLGFDAFRTPHMVDVDHPLVTRGIYGVVRHPQFLAVFMVLWTRDLTDTDVVTNVVLSLYVVAGTKIEERRMLRKYGNQYREYMTRVPGFLPTSLSALKLAISRR
jgi:methanethiol S-methyltransferase